MDRLADTSLARPPRIYTRKWTVKPWAGSLGEILAAVEVGREQVAQDASEEGSRAHISIEFDDQSSQSFHSLDAFEVALQTIDPGEVAELYVRLHASAATAIVMFGDARGLSVKAEGSKDFVSGVEATFMPRLSHGKKAAGRPWRRRSRRQWLAYGAYAMFLATAFLASLITDGSLIRALWWTVVLGAFTASGFFLVSTFLREGSDAFRPRNFVLLPEDGQSPGTGGHELQIPTPDGSRPDGSH